MQPSLSTTLSTPSHTNLIGACNADGYSSAATTACHPLTSPLELVGIHTLPRSREEAALLRKRSAYHIQLLLDEHLL